MSFYENEFNKVVSKCLAWHAKRKSCSPSEVQLMFGLSQMHDKKWAASYKLCAHYKDPVAITAKELVVGDARIDWKNYSGALPPYIAKALVKLCQMHKIGPDKISAMAVMDGEMVRLCLYNGGEYVKDLLTEDIFELELTS